MAHQVLESRLGACCHVAEISSQYLWQGKHETGQEWALEIRTQLPKLGELEAWLLAHHPYEVPLVEYWSTTVTPAYGQWLSEVLDG